MPSKKTRLAFNVDRLRTAKDMSGLTAAAIAAKSVEINQKTLSDWLAGRRTRGRVEQLRALAEVLDVDLDWLRGEATPPVPGLMPYLGATRWSENGYPNSSPWTLDRPPAYQLAFGRMVHDVLKAYWRDVRSGDVGALKLRDFFRRLAMKQGRLAEGEEAVRTAETVFLTVAIERAMGVRFWRRTISVSPQDLDPSRSARLPSPEEVDAFALAMRAIGRAALGPWMEGRARLDYRRFHVATRWLLSGMGMLGGPGWREVNPGPADAFGVRAEPQRFRLPKFIAMPTAYDPE